MARKSSMASFEFEYICDENAIYAYAITDNQKYKSLISKVPGWRDSRLDDKQRCASAVCDRRNSHRRTREDSHRWSTYTRRPIRSWQSSSKRRATFPGSHLKWWKSWASLLHLKYHLKQQFYFFISESAAVHMWPLWYKCKAFKEL